MQSNISNDLQRLEIQTYLLNELQSAIGCDGLRYFSYELEQTLGALRLLVDDIEQPIWGIALDALDENTRNQLVLFQFQPALNMLFDGEVCIGLAEWRDHFISRFSLKKDAMLEQQALEDRYFYHNILRTNLCDDFPRFFRLLNEDLAHEGLEVKINLSEIGQFQVSIKRDGAFAQGAIFKRWESRLNKIQMNANCTGHK